MFSHEQLFILLTPINRLSSILTGQTTALTTPKLAIMNSAKDLMLTRISLEVNPRWKNLRKTVT